MNHPRCGFAAPPHDAEGAAVPPVGRRWRAGEARSAASARISPRPLPKAASAFECHTLEQLPNIGVSLAQDLRLIGVVHPRELVTADAMALYQALCAKTDKRQDPCVLDTFMAVTDFMRGAPPAPWWHYTVQRKALYGQVLVSWAEVPEKR